MPICSSLAHLSNSIDVRDFRLCDQPFTGTNQLPLGWNVVPSFRTISLGSASSTHRHAPVCLRHMMDVELAACFKRGCCGHNSPIGRQIQRGSADLEGMQWRPIWSTLSLAATLSLAVGCQGQAFSEGPIARSVPQSTGTPTPLCAMIPSMSRVALADIITAFSTRPSKGVRIVGIDGPSGSGKSTLTRRLVDRTPATLVEIDDFVSWTDFSGWWPRFDDQVLKPLLRGEDARYQVRDWQNDPLGSSLGGWKIAEWAPLVILDGVTCTREAATNLLAYRIWVEAPEKVRLARGMARDGEQERHLWLAWMQQEREFFSKDHTRERADLYIDGAGSSDVDSDGDEVLTLDEAGGWSQ